MHVVGKLKKYTGEEFYLVKNSWGEIGKYDGYILMSSDFFFLKAVALMLNKKALPEDIRKRL
jgi:bleomycin hydrolase